MGIGYRGSRYIHWIPTGKARPRLMDNATGTERYIFASQLAVLQSCPEAISRLLKNPSSVLLAAKVLVISRLLHTKLSQRSTPSLYIEVLRNRLAALRRRLLASIDKRLKTVDLTRDALIDAMSAFCLATSSSPTDVLRHFHHVRIEAITEQSRAEGDKYDRILRAIRIYLSTLKDTKAAFPSLLTQALESLRSIPLFKSQDLYALVELNLDLHEKWIEDDIKSFTPYIRLNDLQKTESERVLKQWARRALSPLLNNLRETLEECSDTLQVMDLRKHVFELWFLNQHQCTGIEPSEVVDDLRDAFNARWTKIIQMQVMSLADVGLAIQTTVQSWPSGKRVPSQSLWNSSIVSMEISHGGRAFREALIARSQGTNEFLRPVFDRYTAWLHSIETILATITRIQAVKWEDTFTSIDDEDDILNDKQLLLSEDDPRLLREVYSDSVQEAFHKLEDTLQTLAEGLDELNDGERAVFLLRSWRDIRQRRPESYVKQALGLKSIATLQKVVAKTTLRDPMHRSKKRRAKALVGDKVPGRPLWEGDPQLPIQPSPWAFRLLAEVMSSMVGIGSDVWSVHASDALKKELRSSIIASMDESNPRNPGANGHMIETDQHEEDCSRQESVSPSVSGSGRPTASQTDITPMQDTLSNGAVQEGSNERPSSDVSTQQFFDLLCLFQATASRYVNERDDALLSLLSSLEKESGATPSSVDRMKKSAENYWKRTSLLFALLA